jgi:hypothetical protein
VSRTGSGCEATLYASLLVDCSGPKNVCRPRDSTAALGICTKVVMPHEKSFPRIAPNSIRSDSEPVPSVPDSSQ